MNRKDSIKFTDIPDQEDQELESSGKKRGRPLKEAPPVHNENTRSVTMSKRQVTKEEIERGVGIVTDPIEQTFVSPSLSQSSNTITIEGLQQRWRQVFAKYQTLGFESINSAWNSFGANPMLTDTNTQNRRVKKILTPPQDLTKENLKEALGDPENSEMSLRSASLDLYYKNFVYQTLTQLNRNTPRYNYCFNPVYLDGNEDPKKIHADSQLIDKALKEFNPQLTFKTIATQVAIEGKSAYLVRMSHTKKDVDFLVLQKLNSDNVKITGLGSKQQFIVSFNMIVFLEAGYSTSQYPKFIQDAWDEMCNTGIVEISKNGRKRINPKAKLPQGHMMQSNQNVGVGYDYWVQLPQDLCYMFYSDGAHANAFPDAIGLFADLNDLDDYRWLQGNLLSRGVTSILTGEVPLVKDPRPGSDSTAISVDTVLGYTDLFTQSVSANILPFFAPFN